LDVPVRDNAGHRRTSPITVQAIWMKTKRDKKKKKDKEKEKEKETFIRIFFLHPFSS
jgi:hypothetical protein